MFTFLPPDGVTAFTAPLDCKIKSSDDFHIQILDIIHNNYGVKMNLGQLFGAVIVGTVMYFKILAAEHSECQVIKTTLLSGLP
jgi:hypothetical protein